MNTSRLGFHPRKVSDGSAVLGGAIWLVLVTGGSFRRLELLLLLAPLVLVPLLLGMIPAKGRRETSSRWYWYAVLGQPIGALLVTVSFALDHGVLAGMLIVPWVAVTLSMALWGLERLLPRGFEPLSELSIDAGLLYITVGSCWLLISRLEMNPLGFGDPIVFFTGVHFHYAGFVLPLLAGIAGRALSDGIWRRIYAFSVVTIVFGPGLIAAGITLSPLVEVVAVTALTVGVVAFALVALLAIVPARTNRFQQAALTVSSLAIAASMVFAFGYGLSEFLGQTLAGLQIGTMIAFHGHLNALGFALCGALGWRVAVPTSYSARHAPFSTLTADGRVGADYLERNGIVGPLSPSGQMDDLAAYDRPDFDSGAVHPAIRAFYEHTAEYELRYKATWHPGFRTGARLASWLTTRIEQLDLPVGSNPRRTDSQIVDIDDSVDGRTGVRAWIRTDTETGNAVFVAAYATHEHDGETYMNIGLPLPWCNLSAILWMDTIETDGDRVGVRLSSRTRDEQGDEGLYLITPHLPVRLPMCEDFRVWPASVDASQAPTALRTDDTALVAQHEMWLFGQQFLTIQYAIEHVGSTNETSESKRRS